MTDEALFKRIETRVLNWLSSSDARLLDDEPSFAKALGLRDRICNLMLAAIREECAASDWQDIKNAVVAIRNDGDKMLTMKLFAHDLTAHSSERYRVNLSTTDRLRLSQLLQAIAMLPEISSCP